MSLIPPTWKGFERAWHHPWKYAGHVLADCVIFALVIIGLPYLVPLFVLIWISEKLKP